MSDNTVKLKQAACLFDIKGDISDITPYGDGLISTTYLVTTDVKKYIMQDVNIDLFTNPEALMHNIRLVTDFIKDKTAQVGGDVSRCTLSIVTTIDDKDYAVVDGKCYRIYDYIDGATTYSQATADLFYKSALAFGRFADNLSDFDASGLYEILKDFHNTETRLHTFEEAVRQNKAGRAEKVKDEIEFFVSRKEYADMIVSRLKNGSLPIRVTHNDTKLNNVMLDEKNGDPVAVIDLDTVMPGSILYDFGDAIRFGCNTGAEDEPDLSKVHFSMDLYRCFLKGYLEGYPHITKQEKDMLPYGAIIMTYECGMRFLTDYLNGDTYFKTTRQDQNLDRCHTHMRLIEEMEANIETLADMTEEMV